MSVRSSRYFYTRTRIDFVRASRDLAVLEEINARTGELQSRMWGHVTAIVRERPDPVATSLMTSLNDTFDLATSERFAFQQGVPPLLFWLLTGMATASVAALGYQLGLRNQRLRVLAIMFVVMWTAVVTVILDLGAPRLGGIRIGTQPYEWTLQGFQGGVTVPPLPAR